MKPPACVIRGPLLRPLLSGRVEFLRDAELRWDERGILTFVGPASSDSTAPRAAGVILPPFLDCHIHIPQWPIRGRFCEGVPDHPNGGRLLAGLERNVFPFESRCSDIEHARLTTTAFFRDTLSQGVVGGAAYMTVHAAATAAALSILPPLWHVGLVLMNQNCSEYLRTDEENLERDITQLAEQFGHRLVVTDRFAVAVDSPLRQKAMRLATQLGLTAQTHLNEQPGEKKFVEQRLYLDAASYTDVYRRDGLLDRSPILAHCVHMRDEEFDLVAQHGGRIAHCPTSNALLGSGIMPLDPVIARGIAYAICTDVGASPTTSLLNEMATFLRVQAGRSARATAEEALFRTTLGAAQLLGIERQVGDLQPGKAASFIEISGSATGETAEQVIRHDILKGRGEPGDDQPAIDILAGGGVEDRDTLNALETVVNRSTRALSGQVARVSLKGKVVWERDGSSVRNSCE